MDLATTTAAVGLTVSLITIGTTLVRVTNALASLKQSIAELDDKLERSQLGDSHEIEKLQLFSNGVRERMEHINTRLSGQFKEIHGALADIENYLTKNTAYEKRRN